MALGKNIRGNTLYILTLAAAFTLVLTSPATPPEEQSPGVIDETSTPQSTSYCGEHPLCGLVYSSLLSQD